MTSTADVTVAGRPPAQHAAARSRAPAIMLVGNPNVGKTTLFNRLTGQRARVGNYSGVTVECRIGRLNLDVVRPETSERIQREVEIVDLPGTYSLSAHSAEEQIAINAVLGLGAGPPPELCVVVVDAGQLIRNLYLVIQLIELRVPLVIALNMMDEVSHNPPRAAAISRLFGVPCIAMDARQGEGVSALERAIAESLSSPPSGEVEIAYPAELKKDVDRVADALPSHWRSSVERDRALGLWALTSIAPDDELEQIDPLLRVRCRDVFDSAGNRDIDQEVITTRYAFLDAHRSELYARNEQHPPKPRGSEQIDRVLLHPLLGFLIFLAIMGLMFQALFSWSDPAIRVIENVFVYLQKLANVALPAGMLRGLVSDGLLGGVGNVLVFLPQILLLFLFIGILEDSGYMARVAYLMDRIMKTLGLHGRAFVPMLSGFACAVPAILATRTMERKRDRLLTMLVIPLMTCSARLPVYTLIIAALFPPSTLFGWLPIQALLMVALYIFSTTVSLIAVAVLGRTVVRGRRVPLILELPPYRMPSIKATLRMMWERSLVFLREAGTIILACTVLLWALLSFPAPPEAVSAASPNQAVEQLAPSQPNRAPTQTGTHALEYSYGGRLGKAIEPLIAPLGFDWKIGIGIIGAFAAREVFVSTLGLVYGLTDLDDQATPLREQLRAETLANGKPKYSPLTGLSLLVFFALACQCMSTLAVVRRETKSWRWPLFMFGYMTALAWVASFLVYQGGRLLGF